MVVLLSFQHLLDHHEIISYVCKFYSLIYVALKFVSFVVYLLLLSVLLSNQGFKFI